MTLSGLGLLESFLVESPLLYLAFFKTILAALIYSGLLVFLFITCLQNLHFSTIILPTNNRIFHFSVVSTTDISQ